MPGPGEPGSPPRVGCVVGWGARQNDSALGEADRGRLSVCGGASLEIYLMLERELGEGVAAAQLQLDRHLLRWCSTMHLQRDDWNGNAEQIFRAAQADQTHWISLTTDSARTRALVRVTARLE